MCITNATNIVTTAKQPCTIIFLQKLSNALSKTLTSKSLISLPNLAGSTIPSTIPSAAFSVFPVSGLHHHHHHLLLYNDVMGGNSEQRPPVCELRPPPPPQPSLSCHLNAYGPHCVSARTPSLASLRSSLPYCTPFLEGSSMWRASPHKSDFRLVI